MPQTFRFLTPTDLHDIVRGMAVIAKLYDPDPDIRFRLNLEKKSAIGVWNDFDGNNCHCLFSPDGSVILGFDHESPMSPHARAEGPENFQAYPGIYNQVPPVLMNRIREDLAEDLFDPEEVTFCLWNTGNTRDWQKGDIEYPPHEQGDADGQAKILQSLSGFYNDFCAQFEETYNWDLDPDAVADLLSGDRISLSCIRGLKKDANPLEARQWLPTMGFVVEGPSR
jgi:hypothetical protein